MRNFHHPFIVKIIDTFVDSSGFNCIIQELYSEGDLNQYLLARKEEPLSE
jgi:serine/threonine protein kinase